MKTAAPVQSQSVEAMQRKAAGRRPFLTPLAKRPDSMPPPVMGRPGDRWEREAEAMADRAMSPAPVMGLSRDVTAVTPQRLREAAGPSEELAMIVQPRADAGQAESDPQASEPATPDYPLQLRAVGAGRPVSAATAGLISAARGGGDPLAPDQQARLGARLGADFAEVRIHNDSMAVQITRTLRAQAATQGRDIFFNAGRFAPDTPQGAHLLAHELVHTLQQGAVTAEAPMKDSEKDRAAGDGGAKVDPKGPVASPVGAAKPGETTHAEPARIDPQPDAESPIADASAAAPLTDLTLPPRPPPGPADQVAVVAVADLGTSSEGAVAAYLAASPSVMAATAPVVAQTVTTRLGAETADLAANPPVLALRTSGLDTIPLTAPPEVVLPETAIGDGITGADPGNLTAVAAPTPAPFTANAERQKELRDEDSGSFWDRFMNFVRNFIKGIRTSDPSISTDGGDVPAVDLSGEADAGRMGQQRGDATSQVAGVRDDHVAAFTAHPGQANIQPVKVDESRTVAVNVPETAPLEPVADTGMADYAAAPLPADVRALADAKIVLTLDPHLSQPKADAEAAAQTRDADRDREIKTAKTAARALSDGTDAEQRRLVIENRGKIAKLQGEGIAEANKAGRDFDRDAGREETRARGDIKIHVAAEQGKADAEITAGEAKAEAVRQQGEKDAAVKKAELAKAQEDESWWDRVKGAIKSAVAVITDAIDAVFTFVRKKVAELITLAKNAAIKLINAARDWVVDKLNAFRDWAHRQVDKYLKDTFPGLARRINGAIDTVTDGAIGAVNRAADAAIAGVTALADGLSKVLDKILQMFQVALKTAVRVTAAVATGDFEEALRAAIEGACEIAEVDPKVVFDFFDRAGKAIGAILNDPVGFIGKLFGAVGDGVSNFFGNIRTHLIDGVVSWLTGAFAEVQLTGPFEFTVSGILKIVLQVLGITYDAIKAKVIKEYPPAEKVFDLVEKGIEIVQKLVTEGPLALLDDVLAALSNFKDMILDGIREWLIVTALKEGVTLLLSLTNPASAIVKAIKLIYQLVMFLIEKIDQIRDFIMSVYDAVANVVTGNFAAVTKGVEEALARSIPVLIGFVAALLNLGSLAAKVKGLIEDVAKPIHKVIDRIVARIVAFAKKVVAKAKSTAVAAKEKVQDTVASVIAWWKERRKFRAEDGEEHTLYFAGEGEHSALMVASNAQLVSDFLQAKIDGKTTPDDDRRVARAALVEYKKVVKHETDLEKLRAKSPTTEAAKKQRERDIRSKILEFRNSLDDLSQILRKANFGDEDDALVQTHIDWTGNKNKNANALPLTFLSGNTKGTRPLDDPPGWSHAADLNAIAGTSGEWVRGHLINDNLHGPGVKENLVPITKTMNGEMESQAESPLKERIKERGRLYFYHTEVTFWTDTTVIKYFPQLIEITWGTAKRDKKNKKLFHQDKVEPVVKVRMPSKPAATAAASIPSINGGSATRLYDKIAPHGAVTTYFVQDVLLREFHDYGPYAHRTDMKARLYDNVKADIEAAQGVTVKDNRRHYVQATYDAIAAGDVDV